jgi:DNA repair protein RadC
MTGEKKTSIVHWPRTERPRERLIEQGADVLSDAELLAILLRTGTGKQSAVELARNLLLRFSDLRGVDRCSVQELSDIRGIGLAKSAQIKAALELAKRIVQQRWKVADKVMCSEDVYRYIHLRMQDLNREIFRVLFLSGRNAILSEKVLFEGSLSESVVSPREIIVYAVQQAAASVILLHNHPSGDPSPSREDKLITRKITQACHYCDISVLDHIIIGRDGYFSFADEGLLSSDRD